MWFHKPQKEAKATGEVFELLGSKQTLEDYIVSFQVSDVKSQLVSLPLHDASMKAEA